MPLKDLNVLSRRQLNFWKISERVTMMAKPDHNVLNVKLCKRIIRGGYL